MTRRDVTRAIPTTAPSTMRSTSRQALALFVVIQFVVLAAACARTTEEWAVDVEQWDPYRRDVAIAALGRVPYATLQRRPSRGGRRRGGERFLGSLFPQHKYASEPCVQ